MNTTESTTQSEMTAHINAEEDARESYKEALEASDVSFDQSHENLMRFLRAGNARATFRSLRTGTRYTYRVRASKDGAVWFVSVLTGADNNSSYTFVGTIFQNGQYRHSSKSRIGQDAPSVKAFCWVMDRLNKKADLTDLEVSHEGCCGRCGRALTVPESVKMGLGPECAKR